MELKFKANVKGNINLCFYHGGAAVSEAKISE